MNKKGQKGKESFIEINYSAVKCVYSQHLQGTTLSMWIKAQTSALLRYL